MTKHTPGPWAVGGTAVYAGETRVALCDVDLAALTYARVFANARLIAAAPDLLETMEELIGALDNSVNPKNDDDVAAMIRYTNAEKAARAAIAKARIP